MDPGMECKHGAERVPPGQRAAYVDAALDIKLLCKETKSDSPSKKKKKKIVSRIEKSLLRFSGQSKSREVGLANAVAISYASATVCLLCGDTAKARDACLGACRFEALRWETMSADFLQYSSVSERSEITTEQGFVRFVARHIPCDCLDDMKKELKKQVKRGHCLGCAIEFPVADLSHCSRCKIVSYCSENCQRKDWKNHKELCKRWKEQKDKIEFGKSNAGSGMTA
jgi:MYND finger